MTPPAKQWIIFRHGLATHSKTGYGDRIVTAEVLPEGRPPIQRLGIYLKDKPFEYGVRSEFIRCQQTAQIVTDATGHVFVPDSRLNEQVKENFEQVRARVAHFVQETSALPYQHIWICTHGIIIAALKSLLIKGAFTPGDANDYTQPGQLLIIQEQTAEVIRFEQVV